MSGEKPRCKAILPSGGRCSAGAEEGQDWCYNHSPERAAERRKNAAAGGHARSRRPPDELEEVKEQIKTISAAVLKGGMDAAAGTIDRPTAATLFMGYNTLLRAVEVQRKLDHAQELEDRVADLRERLDELKRRRFGAA